jgi:hypothetical protein
VAALKGPGILVLGQPLFSHSGSWKDHTLPDYTQDHTRLCTLLTDSLQDTPNGIPHDILLLSGDIHIGRYTVGRIAGIAPFNEVHELVASSASRIAPDMRTPTPEAPPSKVAVRSEQGTIRFDVEMMQAGGMPTLANNIGGGPHVPRDGRTERSAPFTVRARDLAGTTLRHSTSPRANLQSAEADGRIDPDLRQGSRTPLGREGSLDEILWRRSSQSGA